jgi:hypothetical protein
MVLNNIAEWLDQLEQKKRIEKQIADGQFLELRKMNGFVYPRIIGTVGEVLRAEKKKKSKPFLDEIDVCNSESVFVQMAVEKAVKKCAALKMSKIEVAKQNNVEKPAVLELPKIALHGRNTTLNQLLSWKVLRGMMVNGEL